MNRKEVEGLREGDRIVLKIPRQVEVVSVKDNPHKGGYEGDKLLTYRLPDGEQGTVDIGSKVSVPEAP